MSVGARLRELWADLLRIPPAARGGPRTPPPAPPGEGPQLGCGHRAAAYATDPATGQTVCLACYRRRTEGPRR